MKLLATHPHHAGCTAAIALIASLGMTAASAAEGSECYYWKGPAHALAAQGGHDCTDTLLVDINGKPHAFDIADRPSTTQYDITPLYVKPLRLLPMDGPSCTEGMPEPGACTWIPTGYAGNPQHPWTDGSSPANEKLDPNGWMFVDPGSSATDGSTPAPVIKASFEIHDEPSITDEPCHADINNDGRVDAADLHAIFDRWGEGSCPADCNGDGIVDALDIMAVLASWGYCP